MRVLGIDPAIRHTGYAVVEGDFRQPRALDYGTLLLPARLKQSDCLSRIHASICELIERWQPDEIAIEAIIHVQSRSTAIAMGSSRGAVLIAGAAHQLPIMEYPPSSVKMAAVGKGAAQKAQVAFMMRALLQLRETPEPDAADALAIAYTHLVATDPSRQHLFEKRRYV